MSTRVRNSLRAGGLVCLLVSLLPWLEMSTTTEPDGTAVRRKLLQVGLPFSPLFKLQDVRRDRPSASKPGQVGSLVSSSVDMGIQVVSWSWLPLIAGVVLLDRARHRPEARDQAATEPETPTHGDD